MYLCMRMSAKKINIAIDGYSSCGKSTLARDLAKALGYLYIDSGAMYRAVTLYLLQNEIPIDDTDKIIESLEHITITFERDEVTNSVYTALNGRDVEGLIRSLYVSQHVSEVSAIKEVRAFLVSQQQKLGKGKGVVMDGRDIGTVVFADAAFKLFVTSDAQTRAQRRFDELKSKGAEVSMEAVKENLEHRDYIDTHRAESPLYKADDAILLDNSILSREDQLRLTLNMANKIISTFNDEAVLTD